MLRSRRQALGEASCRALVELRAELLQSLVELLQSFARTELCRALVEIRAELRARLLLYEGARANVLLTARPAE